MNKQAISELKAFLKKHHAYCSFHCVPVPSDSIGLSLYNGIFKALFIGGHTNVYERQKRLEIVEKHIKPVIVREFNRVLSEVGAFQ